MVRTASNDFLIPVRKEVPCVFIVFLLLCMRKGKRSADSMETETLNFLAIYCVRSGQNSLRCGILVFHEVFCLVAVGS